MMSKPYEGMQQQSISPRNTNNRPTESEKSKKTNRRKRVLLGISGSVAAVKGPELALQLSRELDDGSGVGADVAILLTHGGENFWQKSRDYNAKFWDECNNRISKGRFQLPDCQDGDSSIPNMPLKDVHDSSPCILLYGAQDEWKGWNKMSDPVLHIQLRDWADIAIIAPLSAHTLAKIANGLCDDTLTCVMRAWNFGHTPSRRAKPLVLAPAMNTGMWDHPLTQLQLKEIQGFCNVDHGRECLVKIVEPQVKTLACGEVGNGAMASVMDIVNVANNCFLEK